MSKVIAAVLVTGLVCALVAFLVLGPIVDGVMSTVKSDVTTGQEIGMVQPNGYAWTTERDNINSQTNYNNSEANKNNSEGWVNQAQATQMALESTTTQNSLVHTGELGMLSAIGLVLLVGVGLFFGLKLLGV